MSRKRKVNKTGRGSSALSDFVAIERYLLRSLAWRSLKAVPRAAYIEIGFCYDGKNNGRIQMSARNLGDRLGVNKATASRALKELEANGLIVTVRKSHFSQKLKTCSEYRLTALKCDVSGDFASKEFMRWQPKIQNSVATTQPTSCTSATDGLKTTRNSPNQLHQSNREAPLKPLVGCTSAPHLYSTILPATNTAVSDGAGKPKARDQRDSIEPKSFDSFQTLGGVVLKAMAQIRENPASEVQSSETIISQQKIAGVA